MSLSASFQALEALGFNPFFQQQLEQLRARDESRQFAELGPERVIAQQRGEFTLLGVSGQRRAVLGGRLRSELAAMQLPCVGDWVLCDAADGDLGRIAAVFERASVFARKRAGNTSAAQVVAANIDLGIVVSAFAPPGADEHAASRSLNMRRIERYLAAIAESGARSLVLLNKADLCSDAAEQARALSADLAGADVVAVSAHSGFGIAALETRLARYETAALLGSSGVGKSSIVNRWLGRVAQRVEGVREADARGRHTTTHRELFPLPHGAFLIDTPGMRELALASLSEAEDSSNGFDDVDALSRSCRYRDCRHESEPGCAVLAAVQSGVLDHERLLHRQKLARELDWQRQRQDQVLRRENQRAQKAQSRQIRARLVQKGRK